MTDPWWKSAVLYQVYPRSFQDSDGDGIGDLRGITARLPYLAELGVDALWLSPVFASPMADFGYDVSDYTAIDPLFGSMADFDALLHEAHARGLKVLLDFVPNHTSDPAPLVSRKPRLAHKPKTRLVHLARRRARRRSAQQLAVGIRRLGLGIRRTDRPILLPRVFIGAAGPQLAQPGGARGHA